MDMPAITGALTGASNAFNLLKAALGTSNKVEINAAVAAMSENLVHARTAAETFQQEAAALRDEVKRLKERTVQLEKITADKENYVLKDLGAGAMVYACKPVVETHQSPHWLCVTCLDKNQKSVMQFKGRIGSERGEYSRHECPTCRTAIVARYNRKPGAEGPS